MADKNRPTLKQLANTLAGKAIVRDIEKHQQNFRKAEQVKNKLEARRERARQRYKELKEQLDTIRRDERAAKNRSMSSISRLGKSLAATRERSRELDLELREARALVKESRLLVRAAERKQRALTQALLTFIKSWEKKYNKKYAIEIQNAEVRRRWLQDT